MPCFLYSCSLFIFIKDNSFQIFKFINEKLINKYGALTLGPFFMHLPLIDLIHKYFTINRFSLEYRLLGGFFLCIICLFITNYLKKIPILKYLVP